MDDEVIILGEDGTEHVFPAGFDPKRAAEIVRGQGASASGMPMATPAVGAALGAAKAAPGVLSFVNRGANAASKVEPVVASIIGSAAHGIGPAIGAGTPKAAGVLARATAAAKPVASPILDATGKAFMRAGTPGILLRGANVLSKIAGKASLPLTIASATHDSVQMIHSLAERAAYPKTDPIERQAILQALSGAGVQ